MKRQMDLEMQELKRQLILMDSRAEEAITRATRALEQLSPELAQEVIKNDTEIDRMENELEEKTVVFIARHQPLASDLRFIVMVSKIASELERIADLAVDIAQRALELVGQPHIKPLIDIPKLTRLAQQMVNKSIEAFVNLDGDLARFVRSQDDQADFLRDAIYLELTEIISRNGNLAPRAIPLILVARHLERICDHATNIAEDVVFLAEAKTIKHSGAGAA
ncbi:MAG: hypothetical protein BWY73_00500 [candidate division TA06 bacterium ADurb.Bin417]|uniref:Phosphate-specific transport system accessory protein PhoU n=1 Tax=candidate division TA06 bacterium ADurb.Bin417 TaxID=1852828 RepID=A0A1V5MIW5_UNCT6|nr:MAG: hypothetical protein BWY73_00500 [candidate division TA06 bacterium ADurb.Bin417]